MPTRIELLNVVRELRHAPTRLAPIDVAERVQHAIVRLEEALASPPPLPPMIDAVALTFVRTYPGLQKPRSLRSIIEEGLDEYAAISCRAAIRP